MNIVIPMAGRGTRLRPHTLTDPKPLIPVAGIPIVERLVAEITKVLNQPINEIAFVIGDFGKEVENNLKDIAKHFGATPKIYYQEQPLGTAHAVYCAHPSLQDEVIVAFADTLFTADFKLDATQDGIIWVQKVNNPEAYGVVQLDNKNIITEFIEKPQKFVSDLAIIGIYYFKDGDLLRNELNYLIDNKITVKGEYYLTDALVNMQNKGVKFVPGEVKQWMDCGNKVETVKTNAMVLENSKNMDLVEKSAKIIDSVIIPPCYIGKNAVVKNSVIGPYVSIGANTSVANSIIKNSLIQRNTKLSFTVLQDSMIGNHVTLKSKAQDVSIGDYSIID